MSGVERVLEAAGGSPTRVAERVSTDEKPCYRQQVEYWMRRGYVPSTWTLRVAEVFGVALHELNPSVYPARPIRVMKISSNGRAIGR